MKKVFIGLLIVLIAAGAAFYMKGESSGFDEQKATDFMQQRFDAIDTNSDGLIDRAEFDAEGEAILKTKNFTTQEEIEQFYKVKEQAWNAFDADNNNLLSFEEFKNRLRLEREKRLAK